ncbi:MAG TPA: ribulose-phosphate 3-epimerase [Trueperaceae bacterium]|nr:ribulose-phosphate 3-epimerase [Trueperaceae bacterium]
MTSYKLAASVLAADFTRLGQSVQEAQDAGVEWLHLDVMDGHFVPNVSFGPAVVAAVRSVSTLPLDVHLMIESPSRMVERFVAAGADVITVHAEVDPHLHRLLQQVRATGAKVGLAVNPLTPLAVLEGALPYLDLALVMSVNPGFGGQEFIAGSLARVEALRRMRDRANPNCLIEVDGGVTAANVKAVVEAGADVVVAGTAVFGGMGPVADNVAALRAAVGG